MAAQEDDDLVGAGLQADGRVAAELKPLLDKMMRSIAVPARISALGDVERRYAEYFRYLQRMMSGRQGSHEAHSGYRQFVAEQYQPRHAHLRSLDGWQLAPELVVAVALLDADADTEAQRQLLMARLLKRAAADVYVLPVLAASTAEQIVEEMEHFFAWCDDSQLAIFRPNSMNNYGAILDDFGFADALQQLSARYVQPLAAVLWPGYERLDSHHGFVVSYEENKDLKLDFHVDDAEVTLNVCLGRRFTGSSLSFGGVRCARHQQTPVGRSERFEFHHSLGVGCLHLGQHRHSALPLESGQRHNLILWCRSSSYRARHPRLLKQCPYCFPPDEHTTD